MHQANKKCMFSLLYNVQLGVGPAIYLQLEFPSILIKITKIDRRQIEYIQQRQGLEGSLFGEVFYKNLILYSEKSEHTPICNMYIL